MSLIHRSFLPARPQELGKIKIGGLRPKTTSSGGKDFQPPERFEHFVVTTLERGPDGNFRHDEHIMARLRERCGPKPMEIPGILMFETVAENLHTEMTQYSGRAKKAVHCDGVTCHDLVNKQEYACPRAQGGGCPQLGNNGNGCKPYARLHLQLMDSPDTGGYHVFRTTSWEATNNLQTALEEIFGEFGTLYKAPVLLRAYFSEDHYEQNGQAKTGRSLKVGLTLAMSRAEVGEALIAARRRIESTKQQLRLMAAKVEEDLVARDAEEADEIRQEFFPEEGVQAAAGTQATTDGLKASLGVGPVVDAEVEDDDGTSPEPTPQERASAGMLVQLDNLIAKARQQDLPGLFALESQADKAKQTESNADVKAAVSAVSLALVEAKAKQTEA